MKRLTYRDNEGRAQWAPELLEDNTGMAGSVIRSFVADVEDILGDEYDLDRLRELVQADREGRCVVIRPNSVTDDNYKIICRKINAEDIHLGKMRNVHEKHK